MNITTSNFAIEDYLNLPYTFECIRNENGSYFIKVKEFEGCMTEGDTIEEAFEMIKDAMRVWIEGSIEDGFDIPLPESMVDTYSGKILLRISKSLHRDLAAGAKANNVSINAYVFELLSQRHCLREILDHINKQAPIAECDAFEKVQRSRYHARANVYKMRA